MADVTASWDKILELVTASEPAIPTVWPPLICETPRPSVRVLQFGIPLNITALLSDEPPLRLHDTCTVATSVTLLVRVILALLKRPREGLDRSNRRFLARLVDDDEEVRGGMIGSLYIGTDTATGAAAGADKAVVMFMVEVKDDAG